MHDNITVTREYNHKTHGHIGTAELRYKAINRGDSLDVDWTLNGVALPTEGVRHLLTFALQTLQDAYAGADSSDDAVAAWETKLARIQSGEIGTRGGGTGIDRLTKLRRIVAREVARKTMSKDEYMRKLGRSVVEAEQDAVLDAMSESESERGAYIRKIAAKRHADEMAEREAMAELAAMMKAADES